MAKFPASQPTREDLRIQENREQMGVIYFRKKGECRGVGSGSIVNLEGSKLLPNCKRIKWCLLTSDNFLPVRDIGDGDYFFEFLSSDLKTVNEHSLREVAKSDDFYNPTAGLALIPVRPSWVSKFTGVGLKSSVLDKRRTFPTKYYYEGGESESCKNIQCFIVKSCECECKKEPLTVQSFTLITERDDQGRRQYCLRDDNDVDKTIFRRYDDITKRSHLYPRGAVILEVDEPKATCTCIGILNFTEEGLISPVFFTPETLTGNVQLYYPTDVQALKALSNVEEGATSISQTDSAPHSPDIPRSIVIGRGNKPKTFPSAGAENNKGASLTNDDQTVIPDDYTLQHWQKLYEEVKDENTQLKTKSESDQQMISTLKDGNAELRNDIKKTEQQNEELRAQNEDLLQRNDSLRSQMEELRIKYKKLREDRDAECKVLREDNEDVLTENDQLKTRNKKLHEVNRKLRAENTELREGWDAESNELHEVNKENKELKAKNKKLLTENEKLSASLGEVTDQFKELLSQPTSAMFEDDTSSIKDSDNMKAEGPSGSSANSPQGDSGWFSEGEEAISQVAPLSENASELE